MPGCCVLEVFGVDVRLDERRRAKGRRTWILELPPDFERAPLR